MEVLPNNTLINLRKNKGLSQAVAAKKIGISQSMLAMLEAGYRKGSDETKVMIFNRIITKRDKNGGEK